MQTTNVFDRDFNKTLEATNKEIIFQEGMLPTKLLINIIASGCICVVGTIGNFLIIYAFLKTKSLQTTTNMFVFQLALGDFAKAFLIMTSKVINQSQMKIKTSYAILCGLSGCVSSIAFVQAALVLAFIAILRYLKVKRPNLHDKVFTIRKTRMCCVSIFAVTFIFSILPFIGVGKYDYSIFHGVCFADWSDDNLIFRSLFYVFTVGIPYPILIYCYTKIFSTLRNHNRNMSRVRFQSSTTFIPIKRSNKCEDIEIAKPSRNSGKKSDHESNQCRPDINKNILPKIGVQMPAPSSGISQSILKPLDVSLLPVYNNGRNRGHTDILNDPSTYIVGNSNPSPPVTSFSRLSLNHPNNFEPTDVETQSSTNTSKDAQPPPTSTENNLSHNATDASKLRMTQMEIQVTKLMFGIVLMYSFCWLPAFFVNVLKFSDIVSIPADVTYAAITIIDLKICLNPLIYGIGNRQFRDRWKQIFNDLMIETTN